MGAPVRAAARSADRPAGPAASRSGAGRPGPRDRRRPSSRDTLPRPAPRPPTIAPPPPPVLQAPRAARGASLRDLLAAGRAGDAREERIAAVRRLWFWRDRLPESDRLPQIPPWQGEGASTIIGRPCRSAENRTPRIPA